MKKKIRSQKSCQIGKRQWSLLIPWLSLQGLSPRPVLGYSVNPRTEQNILPILSEGSWKPLSQSETSIFEWPDCLPYDINCQLVHLNYRTIYRVGLIFPSSTFGFRVLIPGISFLKSWKGFKRFLCWCADIYVQKYIVRLSLHVHLRKRCFPLYNHWR